MELTDANKQCRGRLDRQEEKQHLQRQTKRGTGRTQCVNDWSGTLLCTIAATPKMYAGAQLTLVILVLVQAALLGDLDVINGINHLLGHAILNNVVPAAVR